jgi:hypothetical protein
MTGAELWTSSGGNLYPTTAPTEVQLRSGSDLGVYTDAGTTRTILLDAASGNVESTGRVVASGLGAYPTGAVVNMVYAGDVGHVVSQDYTAGIYKPLYLVGSEVHLRIGPVPKLTMDASGYGTFAGVISVAGAAVNAAYGVTPP